VAESAGPAAAFGLAGAAGFGAVVVVLVGSATLGARVVAPQPA
jgi:hypothetical protein